VVDAAIVDGVTSLMTQFVGMGLRGNFEEQRESNMLDGGAPWYTVYETADARHISVGAIEPQFFAELCRRIGLGPEWASMQNDRERWPDLRSELAAIFRTRTRDEWAWLLQDSDCCVAPVLSLSESATHDHNAQRNTFVEVGGVRQPAPAPRFSRTPAQARSVASAATPSEDVVARWINGVRA
jgi:alpha-methylacyl-CoA racemase